MYASYETRTMHASRTNRDKRLDEHAHREMAGETTKGPFQGHKYVHVIINSHFRNQKFVKNVTYQPTIILLISSSDLINIRQTVQIQLKSTST
jgi:hypothetical protein